ncbi:OsmC family protein [Pollutibacter soli]|uniref:OsmC family protein n=1 Tax=Pollutibacter soli TaxID=3034157 RepID=UPI0030136F9A
MTSNVIYEGGLRTVATHIQSNSDFETDAPTDNQGKGERFSPTDLVGTALASCMLTTMAIKAKHMEDDLKGIKIDVQKIMVANPRRIGQLNLTFHYPDTFSPTEEQKTLLEDIAMTCPVAESIHPDIKLEVNFNWPTLV